MSIPTTEQRRQALRMVALVAAVAAIDEVLESGRGQEAMDTDETWDAWMKDLQAEQMAATEAVNAEIAASDKPTQDLFHALRKKS